MFLATLACLIVFTDPATAKRGAAERTQSLTFAGETSVPGPDGAPLDLCVFRSSWTAFGFIGVWESRSYVFSDAACAGTAYMTLPGNGFDVARADGLLPAALPKTPPFSLGERLNTSWGAFAIAGLILLAIVKLIRARIAAGARARVLGRADSMGKRAATVMAAAARADGRIDAREVALILETVNRMTDVPLERDEVIYVIENTPKMTPKELAGLGKGLDEEDRRDLVQAAIMITAADGTLDGKEKRFIGALAGALRLTKADLEMIFGRMAAARG
ncbi:MAG: TerB family tellurite resistance protein [Pseudomonadota bacterium]